MVLCYDSCFTSTGAPRTLARAWSSSSPMTTPGFNISSHRSSTCKWWMAVVMLVVVTGRVRRHIAGGNVTLGEIPFSKIK